MKVFKRIQANISASFDSLLNQIENHDALAETTILDAGKAARKARIRLKHMQNDLEKIKHRINDLEKNEVTWIGRLKKAAKVDDDKALECAKRIKIITKERELFQEQLIKQKAGTEKLQNELRFIENRIDQLKIKRNSLASRQSKAEALKIITHQDINDFNGIDDIFERWESKIESYEIENCEGYSDSDEFEQSFVEEEEKDDLKAYVKEVLEMEENNESPS